MEKFLINFFILLVEDLLLIMMILPILKNSGAVVTNFKGDPYIKSTDIIVSRNLVLHKKMLKLLKK